MLRRTVLYLIRMRLHLKKFEKFRFVGQKKDGVYYFTDQYLMKDINNGYISKPSNVSLNYLLNDECEIVKLNEM